MTFADPKFFRPWRKRMGFSYEEAATAMEMSVNDYWKLEYSERPILRFFARIARILWSPKWDWPDKAP